MVIFDLCVRVLKVQRASHFKFDNSIVRAREKSDYYFRLPVTAQASSIDGFNAQIVTIDFPVCNLLTDTRKQIKVCSAYMYGWQHFLQTSD